MKRKVAKLTPLFDDTHDGLEENQYLAYGKNHTRPRWIFEIFLHIFLICQISYQKSGMVYRLASVAFMSNVSFRREPGSTPGTGIQFFLLFFCCSSMGGEHSS